MPLVYWGTISPKLDGEVKVRLRKMFPVETSRRNKLDNSSEERQGRCNGKRSKFRKQDNKNMKSTLA